MARALERFVLLFPLWVTLAGGLAFVVPGAFTWFIDQGFVKPGLGLIMLGMGLTLTLDDFRRVARAPRRVALGVALQYTVMPLLGLAAGWAFGLGEAYAAGLVLVACCPGGTASNVITYLADGDVALSVSMTAVSTVLASVATPALTLLLIGGRVDVDGLTLFLDTAKVVLLPVALGVGLRTFAPRLTERGMMWAPPMAVLMIVLIVGAVLAKNQGLVEDELVVLIPAVFVTHSLGFALGFLAMGMMDGFGRAARTVSIEVGMQNSGLGVVLARSSFANPVAAIPPAISAICHCILGSALAAYWKRVPIVDDDAVAGDDVDQSASLG